MSLYFKRLMYRIKLNFRSKEKIKYSKVSFDENDKLLSYIEDNLYDSKKLTFYKYDLRCNELNIEIRLNRNIDIRDGKKDIHYTKDPSEIGEKINKLNRKQFKKLKNLIKTRKLKLLEDKKENLKENINNSMSKF